jgi:hypothetical protein
MLHPPTLSGSHFHDDRRNQLEGGNPHGAGETEVEAALQFMQKWWRRCQARFEGHQGGKLMQLAMNLMARSYGETASRAAEE